MAGYVLPEGKGVGRPVLKGRCDDMADKERGELMAQNIVDGSTVDWVGALDDAIVALGMTMAQVSKDAGLGRDLFRRLEHGDVPYGELERLMRWMETHLEEVQ